MDAFVITMLAGLGVLVIGTVINYFVNKRR